MSPNSPAFPASPSSPSLSSSVGVPRRSVSAAAAWSVPVAAAVFAAPLAAASTAVPCTSTAAFVPSGAGSTGGDTAVLQSVSSSGAVSTVRITSVLAPDTTTTTRGVSYNLSQGGSGWAGTSIGRVVVEQSFSGFGPAGALVLNQRRSGPLSEVPTPGSDAQTLTFQFFDAQGALFDPVDVRLEIFDITSVRSTSWLSSYWDAVGFSVAPTSIEKDVQSAGVGAGTIADPYRRATETEPTTEVQRTDVFSFDVLPSGSTMTYTQHDGQQGWHFIALSGLSFRATDC